MKNKLLLIALLVSLRGFSQGPAIRNVFIVTLDGIRWQEVFNGPDPGLVNAPVYTPDTGLMKMLYYDPAVEVSRAKLMPFFWNVLARKGRLYGNRLEGNRVNVSNAYRFSYPGYNEILTGYTDLSVNSNRPVENENINILEYLNSLDGFRSRVAAFTSWNIFPYILNQARNGLPVYSGYDSIPADGSRDMEAFDTLQQGYANPLSDTRLDALTFMAAFSYIRTRHPRVVLVSLGECDEDAHRGRYDQYLQHLNEADHLVGELWSYLQSTPGYKDQTVLLITTDHGRGKKTGTWTRHGRFIRGSADSWLAVIGPGIDPTPDTNERGTIYAKQIAATIARILGTGFVANHPVARAIHLTDR